MPAGPLTPPAGEPGPASGLDRPHARFGCPGSDNKKERR